jgi:hypothetical protein
MTTCKNGHPLDGDDADVYVRSNGTKVCRACRRKGGASPRPRVAGPARPRRVTSVDELAPGVFVRASGIVGEAFRVHRVAGDEVTVFGGTNSRRMWRTFVVSRLSLCRAPEWSNRADA